jgi:hypothetical protein
MGPIRLPFGPAGKHDNALRPSVLPPVYVIHTSAVLFLQALSHGVIHSSFAVRVAKHEIMRAQPSIICADPQVAYLPSGKPLDLPNNAHVE